MQGYTYKSFFLFCFLVFLSACESKKTPQEKKAVLKDSSAVHLITIDNALFIIPSPIQTSILLKASGASYSKELLNPLSQASSYSSTFENAINLGVYSADLGYAIIYDQNQDLINYLSVVKQLTQALGISESFDKQLMKQIETNLGNRDSLLYLISDAYRFNDGYLKNNERKNISALIIAGGWIESLYICTSIALTHPNKEIANRIGEQKGSLTNLIKLLKPYYEDVDYKGLVDSLNTLIPHFDAIEKKYTYVQPTTNVEKKITFINSTSEVIISNEELQNISRKIKAIRNKIVS